MSCNGPLNNMVQCLCTWSFVLSALFAALHQVKVEQVRGSWKLCVLDGFDVGRLLVMVYKIKGLKCSPHAGRPELLPCYSTKDKPCFSFSLYWIRTATNLGRNTLVHGLNSSQQSFIVVDTVFHLEKIGKMVISLVLPNILLFCRPCRQQLQLFFKGHATNPAVQVQL